MLRIKPEQVEHFAKREQDRFVTMMTRYLRESFPDRVSTLDDAALSAWVRQGLRLCERAAVTTEPEAAQLILLLLVLGVDADQRFEWAREAVGARGLSPEGKVRSFIEGSRGERLPIDDLIVFEQFETAGGERPLEVTP